MQFIIDRSKWVSGIGKDKIGKGSTFLINDKGFMCCLGFCELQLGTPAKDLLGKGSPDQVYRTLNNPLIIQPLSTGGERWPQSPLADAAVAINDHISLTTTAREVALQQLFRSHGHDMVFTGTAVLPGEALS